MLKVTVVVDIDDGKGRSEVFTAELPCPTGSELRGHAPIYAEHLIAEVGAHIVRKVGALYGDHRDDPDMAAALPPFRRVRPLTDFDKAREGNAKGVLSPQFRFPVVHDPEFGETITNALATLHGEAERAIAHFVEIVEEAQARMANAAGGKGKG